MDRAVIRQRWLALRAFWAEFSTGLAYQAVWMEAMRDRARLENLFLLVTFGDLLGLPVLPPVYTLRLLPHALPAFDPWKRRLLRERDLAGLLE